MSERDSRIDELIERVERVETYLQRMEVIVELIERQLKTLSKP